MKKFLSYLFTFITVFAISTTITIRVKSNMQDNSRPVQNASASSQTTLLSGLLASIEQNPKLDVSGSVDIEIDGKPLNVNLSVQADLTTLTNPNVRGNVVINYNGGSLDLLFTYAQNNIYLSYNNIKLQASVDSIKDVIEIFKNLTSKELGEQEDLQETTQTEEQEKTSGLQFDLDLDAIVGALNEPKRTINGDDYIYEVNLDGLCKLILVCDNRYNIKSADIFDFALIEGIDITASLKVVQDNKLVITPPQNADEHLDIQGVTHAIETLKNRQYLRLNAWAAIYKQDKLFEYVDAFGKVDIKNNKVMASAALNGVVEGKLGVNYVDGTLYANFNNLYLSADQACFESLKDLINNSNIKIGDLLNSITVNTSGIIEWLENNYKQVLDTAIISSDQVKLVADLNGLFGQTGEVSFVINFDNGLINSIQLMGLTIGEYKIKLTIYVDSPSYLDFDFDTSKYYDANKLVNIANTILNLDKAELNANLNLSLGENTYSVNAKVLADIANKVFVGDVNLGDYLISLGVAGGDVYVNYNDVYAKLSTSYITELVSSVAGDSADMANKMIQVVKGLSINEILSTVNLSSNADGIYANIDLTALTGKNLKLNLSLDYNAGIVVTLDIALGNISLDGTITLNKTEQDVEIRQGDYVDVQPFIQNVMDTINGGNIAGTLDVNYGDLSLNGNYLLSVKEVDGKKTFSASFEGSLFNLPVNIYFVDNVIYLGIDNLKVSMPITQIDDLLAWVNKNFNTNLSLEGLKDNLSNSSFNFSDITNLGLTEEGLNLNYKNILVNLTLKDQIAASVQNDKFTASVTVNNTNDEITFNAEEYLPYTSVTGLVDSVIKLVKDKRFALSGKAEVYEGNTLHYSATAIVQVDLNDFKLFGEVVVIDHVKQTEMPFMVAYEGGMWYVDYNNLKVKMAKDDLNEILVVLLELVGIDPSVLPFLKDVANGMNIDVGNISTIVPNIDLNNPLGMVKFLTGISFDGKSLNLSVDSKLVSEQGNGDMLICLDTNGSKLTRVKLDNLYTGVTLNEKFNLDVSVEDFAGVNKPYSGNYIDLSGSNELIKAIINTAELNYFNITGNLDITVMGINLGKVYIDAQIKLDEDRKPEVIISLPSVPVIGSAVGGLNVNNDVPYKFGDGAVDSRQAVVYYKDGYVYMYRKDVVQVSKRVYEKKLKVHIDQVLADPMYYVQYVTGFSDAIIEAINKSLALSEGHTPNLGNIINKYEVSSDGKNFDLALNMYELTNDPNMGEMDIGLTVINTPETHNKNYVGKATFNLTLPFTDAITMILNSDDLALVNIGKTLDFSSLYNYISSYNYGENEEWEASNGSWKKADERTNTITFDTMGGAPVDSITAKVGDAITLPTLADKVVPDKDSGTRCTYEFRGWFTDERCRETDKFTATTMPRKDTLLYAKWVLVKTERIVTITFNSNGGTSYDSISDIEGTVFNLSSYNPTKALTYVKGKYNAIGKNTGKWTYTVTRYTFAGWYTDSNFTTKFTEGKFPSANVTLYAKWNEKVTTEYYYAGQSPQ